MAFDLDGIATGITATIRKGIATELRFYEFPPDSPVAPCVIVMPPDGRMVVYHEAFSGGAVEVNFRLRVLVPAASDRASVKALYTLLSAGATETRSIIDVLEDDPTLDGSASTSAVMGVDDVQRVEWAGTTFLSGDLHLTVYTPRT